MPNKDAQAPVITAELAKELAREGEELRRKYRQRVEAMWTIGRDQRRARSR
jgi:hypothetical protein